MHTKDSKVIIGVFRIDNIDLNNTDASLVSFGFPDKLIIQIITALHREDKYIQYLTFTGKKGSVNVSYDYPGTLSPETYIITPFKHWTEFIAKANLLGSD